MLAHTLRFLGAGAPVGIEGPKSSSDEDEASSLSSRARFALVVDMAGLCDADVRMRPDVLSGLQARPFSCLLCKLELEGRRRPRYEAAT